jgi:glycerophosphoryl diester phosphodiesterase
MNIISHRGYWLSEFEKNSVISFERSFSHNFGIETDVRDFNGNLVISHDPATSANAPLEILFELYRQFPRQPKLALNIKSDGLQAKLKQHLDTFQIENYFVFDMSVPDSLSYLKHDMLVYTRQSEYETVPSYYPRAKGVLLDEFESHWLNDQIIEEHILAGKSLCIISPELHGRTYHNEWEHYRHIEKKIGLNDSISLCTDFPELARDFFSA